MLDVVGTCEGGQAQIYMMIQAMDMMNLDPDTSGLLN